VITAWRGRLSASATRLCGDPVGAASLTLPASQTFREGHGNKQPSVTIYNKLELHQLRVIWAN
jgi:hypothetical protein